jgi:hypothetical protein
MKYIYVVDSQDPYRSHVEEAESKKVVDRYTGETLMVYMGEQAVLNAVYEFMIHDRRIDPGDILAPERP